MARRNWSRCVVVVVAIGLRSARRLRSSCGPRLRMVVQAVVRVAGGEGEHAEVLAAYVVLAAATGAATTIAAAFAAGPAAQLFELVRIVALGALAVSAAVVLVRRASGSAQALPLRHLALATARRVDRPEAAAPAALAVQWVCAPQRAWAGANPIRLALGYAARQTISRVATTPLTRVSPVIGPALELLGAYRTTLDGARFVRHFALTAIELSREPSLLALH